MIIILLKYILKLTNGEITNSNYKEIIKLDKKGYHINLTELYKIFYF